MAPNGQSVNKVIQFGTWVLWTEDDWDDIMHEYEKWQRLQKRTKKVELVSAGELHWPILQSQLDRQRKSKDDTTRHRSQSRFRSRARNTSSSHSQHEHDHRNTSSNSNDKNG